ncbi:MAG: hypothetical protein RBR35_20070 [Salinivirgaceae bacterium]|jgi:hypothetical protein|nr:hypothetical protein [Salinivirgaceae bacterium]
MKIDDLILQGWDCYTNKVANGLLTPENEKMMQLQLAQIFQTLSPIYEYREAESIKILLEVPVTIRNGVNRIIDIVIAHDENEETAFFPIELKCFRLYSRNSGKKRGAQNLGMYDYWEDIENIEGYFELDNYRQGYQLTLTDDPYYVESPHNGPQVAVYSTNKNRLNVMGKLQQPIANRGGHVALRGKYSMDKWVKTNSFYFIAQQTWNA